MEIEPVKRREQVIQDLAKPGESPTVTSLRLLAKMIARRMVASAKNSNQTTKEQHDSPRSNPP